MSILPGRRLFRSPFPLDQSPGWERGSPFNEAQASPGGGGPHADKESQRSLSPPPHLSHNVSPLADQETQEHPSPPHLSHNASPLADQDTQKHFFSPPVPRYGSPQPEQKKQLRVQFTKRRKILAIILVILLLPSFIGVFETINMFGLYRQMQDGMAHLQAAASVFHGSSSGISAKYFDENKLRQAQGDINIAHAEFVSLSDRLDRDIAVGLASQLLPSQVQTARALAHIASDGTTVAQLVMKTMIAIAPSIAPALQQNLLNKNAAPLKPYITPASFQTINTTLAAIEPLVHDMSAYAQEVSLNSLPISSSQRQLLASLLPLLPTLDAGLKQEHQWSSELGWLLGVDSQRSFLIEPMDSTELRATGGFTGQFADLLVNGGHVGPLKLENIGKYEENLTDQGSPLDTTVYPKVVGQTAPAPYSAWWPIANFGLRDANLSADFPTSARIAMNRYAYEFGSSVDGVIMFTPTLIEYILDVTGPITIPYYNRTVTAQNLVSLLHYYQLDNGAIYQQERIEHVTDPQVARKLFTERVMSDLVSAVTHLPVSKLLPMVNEIFHAMKTKDLEAYFTNPQVEALIARYGSTAALDRSTGHDGLYIVQSNLGANKASQYVATTIRDTITLDAKGGATHNLQMTLDYQQKGNVYSFDTYRDYVRVYVPPNSKLLAGNGFDQYDEPYCGDAQSGYTLCSPDVYGDGSLVCTPPIQIGYATTLMDDPYVGTDHPLDRIGPPTNVQSDEAGRAMFGGWVVIPKNCAMKVTLSWYVPPLSQQPYSFLLQAQAGVDARLALAVQPAPGTCSTGQDNSLHVSTSMVGEDLAFTLQRQGSQCSLPGRDA